MKKIFTYALVAMAACMISCSQDETFEQVNPSVPSGMIAFSASVPTDGLQTRAADENVQRFVMQIYNADGNGVTDPDNISANYTLVSGDGNFILDPADAGMTDGTYTAVFWADYDTPETTDPVYNTSWLNWVTVNEGKTMGIAYQGKQEFTVGTTSEPMNVTLTHAVAQVNLSQAEAFTAEEGDHIDVTYTTAQAFNVLTGEIAGSQTDASAYIAVAAGEKAAGSVLGSFAVFAGFNEATVTSFTFSYNDEQVATVDNIPVQGNYQTNISGDYKGTADGTYEFVVTTDDGFDGENEGEIGEGGETGEEGGDEPIEENQAPTLSNPTYSVNGYVISYSVDASDDKALKNYPTVDIYDENWTKIETLSQWPNIGENMTTATISGDITVEEAGTYHICITVNDLEEGYDSVNIENIVIE